MTDDQPKNGDGPAESGPQPLTDAQKLYVKRYAEWLMTLSSEDLTVAVNKVLQPLKAAYFEKQMEEQNVSRPS